ncbi:dUTP diphosphatase [Jeotgalibacillus haloalkalitolerans]|uniref:dUTP diphosphatase n=1 Tax=Jeotgalibacillus haloalkalitolerans TaxID=3104292 RepID=A0ABU5KMQ0_9BACL|nr:dUTP diphosphatase [Jeotgalibacillus sp. HH7-29]MDZ5712424.1 dUTP diphosphatase [Jeotgalibacillus sp. HH7-29]
MWQTLLSKQKKLDDFISSTKNLEIQNVEEKRDLLILSLMVELGELANETKCFKYWSNSQPSEKKVILEEYVDVLHFLLSLGIELEFKDLPDFDDGSFTDNKELSAIFLNLYSSINNLRTNFSVESYIKCFNEFMIIGSKLDFTQEEIYESYIVKNAVNVRRQENGY